MKGKFSLFILFTICFYSWGTAQEFLIDKGKKKFHVSFKHVGSLVILPISINGSPPLNFVLDTGSPFTVITNLEAINHFNLKKGKSIKISGLGKDKVELEAYLSYKNEMQIGNAHSPAIDIVLLFEQGFDLGTRFGLPIYGIIGYDLLKDFVVEVDYIKDQITFYQHERFYSRKNLKKFEEFPLTIRGKKPYIEIQTFLEDKPKTINLLIDTGSWESLWLFEKPQENIRVPEKYIEDYLGYGLNGEIHGKRSRIDHLKIGSYFIENPTTSFPDSLSVSNVSRNERNGTIGSEILQRFTTIYDFQNRKLFLKKNSKFNEPYHYNLAGLELYQPYPELPYLEVSYVRENSPAHKAGLRKGDSVKYLNKKKISIFNNHPHARDNNVSKLDYVNVESQKTETISLPEIIELFKTKEGQLINIVYTRDGTLVERTAEFKLERSI
jgi:hypothetical protein